MKNWTIAEICIDAQKTYKALTYVKNKITGIEGYITRYKGKYRCNTFQLDMILSEEQLNKNWEITNILNDYGYNIYCFYYKVKFIAPMI